MAGKTERISAHQALPGSPESVEITEEHRVFQRSLLPPWPGAMAEAIFGMGCFWGAERLFWRQSGVYLTMVGYAGGYTHNPTYNSIA